MMRRMCCVCHKTKRGDVWRQIPVEHDEPVTHGYCPECFTVVMAEIQSVLAQRRRQGVATQGNPSWKKSLEQGGACA